MNTELRSGLVDLFRKAGQAHHAAFAATGGDDPDWPIWYADYLQAPFAEQLDLKFYKSQLIYCLMNADFEHQARANIERLGVDVELRDIFEDARYRDELIEARGRATVPVLRVNSPNGDERWIPESRDIVRYLERTLAGE